MKKLKELTLKEYTDLKNYRLLCIVFPEATGNFREDCEEVKKVKDKCEWKDGKFEGCEEMKNSLNLGDLQVCDNILVGPRGIAGDVWKLAFCPFCGADIRRPEPVNKNLFCNSECGMRMSIQAGSCQNYTCISAKPEPSKPLIVIIESGDTFVYVEKDIDYICFDPELYREDIESIKQGKYHPTNSWPRHWKSFTGPNPDITELTDEIAKLRPMVKITDTWHNETEIRILTYIDEKLLQCRGVTYLLKENKISYRLATAQELQE